MRSLAGPVLVASFASLAALAGPAHADEVAVPAQELAPMPRRPPPVPRATASAETARQGKLLAGSYACKGNQPAPAGGSQPFQAKLAIKLELDAAWISGTWTDPATKLLDHRSYDDVAKQWTRIGIANDGAHELLTSIGEKGGEWVWEGTRASSAGTIQIRHHEKLAGKALELWGEELLGGTWQKTYQASCKR